MTEILANVAGASILIVVFTIFGLATSFKTKKASAEIEKTLEHFTELFLDLFHNKDKK